MGELPQPSAWRYTHKDWAGRFVSYQYETAKPKNSHHPMYVQMFTQGQMNRYGQACFEEGIGHGCDECKSKAQQEHPTTGDIRALKHRIHELEGEVIGYKRILEAPPTQPALSDDEILNCFYASKSEGMAAYMLAVGRAIEAHCRGGVK